jgi:hypothetical protein
MIQMVEGFLLVFAYDTLGLALLCFGSGTMNLNVYKVADLGFCLSHRSLI